jgi:hypothetical protein
MKSRQQFEEAAMDVLRQAARDAWSHGPPLDAAFPAMLAEIVRAAWRGGREQSAAEVCEAYGLMLTGDDQQIVRDTLRDILPVGWKIPG